MGTTDEGGHRKQGFDKFLVFVNNKHLNVVMEGVVGKGAYIALHEAEGELVYNDYITYSYIEDLFTCAEVEGNPARERSLISVTGANWFNHKASRGMRIVVWDSIPGAPTVAPYVIATVPEYVPFVPAPAFPKMPKTKEGEHDHDLDVFDFKVFLNNGHWNVGILAAVSTKARVRLYQGSDNTAGGSATKVLTPSDFAKTMMPHRETRGLQTYMLDGESWYNVPAISPCRFEVWDVRLVSDPEKGEFQRRQTYHVPENIIPDPQILYP